MNNVGTICVYDRPGALEMLCDRNEVMKATERAVNGELQQVEEQLDAIGSLHGFVLMELPRVSSHWKMKKSVLLTNAKEFGYCEVGLCVRDVSVSVQIRGNKLDSVNITAYHELGHAIPLFRTPLSTRITALERLESLLVHLALTTSDYAEAAQRLTGGGSGND